MSLTPPPPPPPHRPSNLLPSGCKTPILGPTTRRLSSASSSVPSPNQLRQILADITHQVTNSPQSPRIPSSTTTTTTTTQTPTQTTTTSSTRHPTINSLPAQRQTGPVTRSRSMLRYITPRSSLTPRGTRSNTPVRDENQSNPAAHQTPRTPFTGASVRSPTTGSMVGSPASARHGVGPYRHRTLSSVSSLASLASPPAPTSAASPRPPPALPPLRLRSDDARDDLATPPLTPSSSANSLATDDSLRSAPQAVTPRERRSLDQLDLQPLHPKPHSGSLAKRRRRNPSGLGRL